MNRIKNLSIVALLAILVAAPLAAQPGMGGPGGAGGSGGRALRGGGFVPDRILRNVLGFSEEQFAQYDALKDELKATLQPLNEAKKDNRAQLREQFVSDDPQAQIVGELTIANWNLDKEIRGARKDFADSFESILTAEQAEAWNEFKDKRRPSRGRGRRGPR